MKSNEIKIGNYVSFLSKYSDIWTETVIENPLELNKLFNFPDSFKPIELNEHWLIKFGFEKKIIKYTLTECAHYQNAFCWVYLIRGGFEVEIITGKERNNLMKVYNYVHQLQNIHSSIFGVELSCA